MRLEQEFAERNEKDSINEDIMDENARLKMEIEELKKALNKS